MIVLRNKEYSSKLSKLMLGIEKLKNKGVGFINESKKAGDSRLKRNALAKSKGIVEGAKKAVNTPITGLVTKTVGTVLENPVTSTLMAAPIPGTTALSMPLGRPIDKYLVNNKFSPLKYTTSLAGKHIKKIPAVGPSVKQIYNKATEPAKELFVTGRFGTEEGNRVKKLTLKGTHYSNSL